MLRAPRVTVSLVPVESTPATLITSDSIATKLGEPPASAAASLMAVSEADTAAARA